MLEGDSGNETTKEQREVSYFDPEVDQLMVIVELKTLQLDNLASCNQREAFIQLYTTLRKFPNDPEEPFTLKLEYRDANVIDFGNKVCTVSRASYLDSWFTNCGWGTRIKYGRQPRGGLVIRLE